MAKHFYRLLLVLLITLWINENEASTPVFLQAITSALSTIPFTAGPMTTGLMGAKLAVGSKLLYYLGFFGRRRSKPKPKAPTAVATSSKPTLGNLIPFSPAMQAAPFQAGFGAGGFPQQFGGFGGFGGSPYGYDPAQMFQMLAAQGIDPATIMQTMNFEGPAAGGAFPSSQFQFPPSSAASGSIPSSQFQFPASSAASGVIPSSQFPFPAGSGSADGGFMNSPQGGQVQQQSEPNAEDDNSDSEVESFFAFLKDMDDNKCISRLMCDIGANPSFLGEFSENIHGIVSTLNVMPSSGAHQYIAIMESGRSGGACGQKFTQCNDGAYEVVKNVAPSVNMPQNINADAINQL